MTSHFLLPGGLFPVLGGVKPQTGGLRQFNKCFFITCEYHEFVLKYFIDAISSVFKSLIDAMGPVAD